jgi:hypothetical protein
MDVSAPHAAFTIAAYLLTAGTLLILSLAIVLRARHLRQQLDEQPPGDGDGT